MSAHRRLLKNHCIVSGSISKQIMGWQAKPYRRPTRNKPDPTDPNRPVVDPKDPVQVNEPNTRWSTDLTKIYVKDEGWANLIPVLDNCTRECIGWVFDRRGRAQEAQDAVREAVNKPVW